MLLSPSFYKLTSPCRASCGYCNAQKSWLSTHRTEIIPLPLRHLVRETEMGPRDTSQEWMVALNMRSNPAVDSRIVFSFMDMLFYFKMMKQPLRFEGRRCDGFICRLSLFGHTILSVQCSWGLSCSSRGGTETSSQEPGIRPWPRGNSFDFCMSVSLPAISPLCTALLCIMLDLWHFAVKYITSVSGHFAESEVLLADSQALRAGGGGEAGRELTAISSIC